MPSSRSACTFACWYRYDMICIICHIITPIHSSLAFDPIGPNSFAGEYLRPSGSTLSHWNVVARVLCLVDIMILSPKYSFYNTVVLQEYRSCVFACDTNDCNSAPNSHLPSPLLHLLLPLLSMFTLYFQLWPGFSPWCIAMEMPWCHSYSVDPNLQLVFSLICCNRAHPPNNLEITYSSQFILALLCFLQTTQKCSFPPQPQFSPLSQDPPTQFPPTWPNFPWAEQIQEPIFQSVQINYSEE